MNIEEINSTIHTVTDLHPLWGTTREEGEEVVIEVWAGCEDAVRDALSEDCEGQLDEDTYVYSGENELGDDVTWTIRIAHIFGSKPPGLEKCRVDMVDSCAICGEVASSENPSWVAQEADLHGVKFGDVVCDDCAS